MKHLFILFLAIYSYTTSAQQYSREARCGSDTITTDHRSHKIYFVDSASRFRAVECTSVSKLGIRLDVGMAGYNYNNKTSQWLGNHRGALIGISIAHNNFNIGVRCKPWTVNPDKELVFDGDTLPLNAKVNPVKFDYFVSYSINFRNNISLEPYAGVSQNVFYVINEDILKRSFAIPDSYGMITGVTINKYLPIREFQFLTVFLTGGYSAIDFSQTHNFLGRGYLEWAVGIGYKSFGQRSFLRRVD